MLKQLAAIALNLLLMSSPAMALMADDLEGVTVAPTLENRILFGIFVDNRFTDKNCYGIGDFSPYRPDMAITIRTLGGKVYDSVRPYKFYQASSVHSCVYIADIKVPLNEPFLLSIAGIPIPAEYYEIKRGNYQFSSMLSDLNLLELSTKEPTMMLLR